MDYRHTEDFARCMERAELRAQQLRNAAIDAFFAAIAHAASNLWHRLVRPGRADTLLPEA